MDNVKEAWKVFADVWVFYKSFFEVSHTDEYWERVISEADRLYKENPTPLKSVGLSNICYSDAK